MVEQAVHGGAGHEWVAKERRPLVDGPIRRDDRRAVLVALSDDLVEVDRLVVAQRAEPEVVDDQQIGADEAETGGPEGDLGCNALPWPPPVIERRSMKRA